MLRHLLKLIVDRGSDHLLTLEAAATVLAVPRAPLTVVAPLIQSPYPHRHLWWRMKSPSMCPPAEFACPMSHIQLQWTMVSTVINTKAIERQQRLVPGDLECLQEYTASTGAAEALDHFPTIAKPSSMKSLLCHMWRDNASMWRRGLTVAVPRFISLVHWPSINFPHLMAWRCYPNEGTRHAHCYVDSTKFRYAVEHWKDMRDIHARMASAPFRARHPKKRSEHFDLNLPPCQVSKDVTYFVVIDEGG